MKLLKIIADKDEEDGKIRCPYCCKELDSIGVRESHIKQRHLDAAFVCKLCDTGDHHHEADLPAMKRHLKESHEKSGSVEEIKDWVRFPRNFRCVKCNMCGTMFHAQEITDVEFHFKLAHEDCEFSTGHLDFLCRLCMTSGRHDTMDELQDHFQEEHPNV